jgi:hypothetical protein
LFTYSIELKIRDTIDTAISASYLDLLIEIDFDDRVKNETLRADFNFSLVNFPFICRNIPAFGVYISQLIRYSTTDSFLID